MRILVNVLKRKREETLPFYQNRMKKLSNYSLSILLTLLKHFYPMFSYANSLKRVLKNLKGCYYPHF